MREARCSCGQLRVEVDGEPLRISICHCLACQRRSGGPFGQQARFDRAQARIAGESTCYRRDSDSGNWVEFHFCPRCGATVYYLLQYAPDAIAIPIGAFADPNFPPPRVSVYDEYRHPWVQLPAQCLVED